MHYFFSGSEHTIGFDDINSASGDQEYMGFSSICKLKTLVTTFINQVRIMFPYCNRHNKKRDTEAESMF